jgi:cell division protein FtsA
MGFFEGIFGKKNGKGRAKVALDFGLSGIRYLVFTDIVNNKLQFKVAGFEPYAKRDNGLFVIQAGEIEALTQDLVKRVPSMAAAESVHVGFGGEFLRSSMFRAVFDRENSKEKIDQAEFSNILEKAERAGRENVAEHLRSQNERNAELRLVSSYLEEITIDGYSVPDPVGFTGKEIEVAIYNLYAEDPYMELLQNLKKTFRSTKLYPHASSYSLCRSFALSSVEPCSAVFIEAGKGLTSVSIVLKNVFLGTKPFAIGGNMFTRALSGAMGVGWDEADQIKKQYAGGGLSARAGKNVSSIMSRASAVWASGVELALEEFIGAADLFPSQFYIYGDEAWLPDLAKILGEPGRFKNLPFLEKKSFSMLSPESLPFIAREDLVSKMPGSSSADTALFCVAYDALRDSSRDSELGRILQRATKLAYS